MRRLLDLDWWLLTILAAAVLAGALWVRPADAFCVSSAGDGSFRGECSQWMMQDGRRATIPGTANLKKLFWGRAVLASTGNSQGTISDGQLPGHVGQVIGTAGTSFEADLCTAFNDSSQSGYHFFGQFYSSKSMASQAGYDPAYVRAAKAAVQASVDAHPLTINWETPWRCNPAVSRGAGTTQGGTGWIGGRRVNWTWHWGSEEPAVVNSFGNTGAVVVLQQPAVFRLTQANRFTYSAYGSAAVPWRVTMAQATAGPAPQVRLTAGACPGHTFRNLKLRRFFRAVDARNNVTYGTARVTIVGFVTSETVFGGGFPLAVHNVLNSGQEGLLRASWFWPGDNTGLHKSFSMSVNPDGNIRMAQVFDSAQFNAHCNIKIPGAYDPASMKEVIDNESEATGSDEDPELGDIDSRGALDEQRIEGLDDLARMLRDIRCAAGTGTAEDNCPDTAGGEADDRIYIFGQQSDGDGDGDGDGGGEQGDCPASAEDGNEYKILCELRRIQQDSEAALAAVPGVAGDTDVTALNTVLDSAGTLEADGTYDADSHAAVAAGKAVGEALAGDALGGRPSALGTAVAHNANWGCAAARNALGVMTAPAIVGDGDGGAIYGLMEAGRNAMVAGLSTLGNSSAVAGIGGFWCQFSAAPGNIVFDLDGVIPGSLSGISVADEIVVYKASEASEAGTVSWAVSSIGDLLYFLTAALSVLFGIRNIF